jgi:hypothetical protein
MRTNAGLPSNSNARNSCSRSGSIPAVGVCGRGSFNLPISSLCFVAGISTSAISSHAEGIISFDTLQHLHDELTPDASAPAPPWVLCSGG